MLKWVERMAQQLSEELEYAKKLEERAHRLRMVMLSDPEFMAAIQAGYEAAQRGETVSLDDLDRELGWA